MSSAPESFEAAFDGLAAIAYRVGYRLLGYVGAAEDVAQESLARAYARWRRVGGHAEPWVARVAANLAIDQLRSHQHRRRAPLGDAVPAAASTGIATTDRLELARLVAELPRRQREVVVLRYLADRSEAETAAVLGTSVGTVKTHAHRALSSLRSSWNEAEAEAAAMADVDLDAIADPGGT